jgi:hypothetical protein
MEINVTGRNLGITDIIQSYATEAEGWCLMTRRWLWRLRSVATAQQLPLGRPRRADADWSGPVIRAKAMDRINTLHSIWLWPN